MSQFGCTASVFLSLHSLALELTSLKLLESRKISLRTLIKFVSSFFNWFDVSGVHLIGSLITI